MDNCLSLSFLQRGIFGDFEVYFRDMYGTTKEVMFSHEGLQRDWQNVLIPVRKHDRLSTSVVSGLAAKT